MKKTSDLTSMKTIQVVCPDCQNANRESRRRCKFKGGTCGGVGMIEKFVPVGELDVADEGDFDV